MATFQDQMAADAAFILRDGGEFVETLTLIPPDNQGDQFEIRATIVRGNSGLSTINSQNRGFFPPELVAKTEGEIFRALVSLADLDDRFPEVGWAALLPEDSVKDKWDYSRIEVQDNVSVFLVFTRRKPLQFAPHQRQAMGL